MLMDSVYKALTASHVAILGKTGSGKTYAAKGMVERLLCYGDRVCVLDPTGVWWGLKTGPNPPVVLGGDEHYRDLPLAESDAGVIAQLIGEGKLRHVVLDLSGLSISGQHRFAERLLEELYRATDKGVLHLVVDEADEFAPQSGAPGSERLLGATARIVQRGRARGFRVMLISQRPAVLNKRVLTQCNSIVAMRLIAPQDRKAIEEWVRGQADESAAKSMLGSLAALKRGEGWIWAPDTDLGLVQVTFPPIASHDSGQTPDGSERQVADLVPTVDVTELRGLLAEAGAKAAENDPAALKKRIAELEARLDSPPPKVSGPTAAEIQEAKQLVLRAAIEVNEKSRMLIEVATTAFLGLYRAGEAVMDVVTPATWQTGTIEVGKPSPRVVTCYEDPSDLGKLEPSPEAQKPVSIPPELSSRTSVRLLGAYVRLAKTLGSTAVSRDAGAFLAGLNPKGGHFANSIGPLSTHEYLIRQGPTVIVTQKAIDIVGKCLPVTLSEYHEAIRGLLSGRTLDMFNVLTHGEMTNAELGRELGMNPKGGHFANSIGPLSTLGLIVRDRGMNRPTDLMRLRLL